MNYCWFCGRFTEDSRLILGLSIGGMVYGSYLRVSESSGLGNKSLEDGVHDQFDAARICHGCVREIRGGLDELDASDVEFYNSIKDYAVEEVVSYDTGLRGFDDRSYFFGCWFGDYPITGRETRFDGMPLGDLYSRGLRLRGGVRFGRRELARFLECFGSSDDARRVSESTADYFANLFNCESRAEGAVIAGVRACIFNVTIMNDLKYIDGR